MVMKSAIIFDRQRIPPRAIFPIPLILGETAIADFILQIHALVLERNGALWYYPSEGKTSCRFEWHRRWQRRELGLRLGLRFDVNSENQLEEVEFYAADSRVFVDEEKGPPELSNYTTADLFKHFKKTVTVAIKRANLAHEESFEVLYYLRVNHGAAWDELLQTSDGKIRLFPVKMAGEYIVSPMGISVNASTLSLAETKAAPFAKQVCGIFTLATGFYFDVCYPKGPRNYKRPKIVDQEVPIQSLYPPSRYDMMEGAYNPKVGAQFLWVWDKIDQLAEADRKIFKNALFAYYASEELKRENGSIASVSLVAALGSLAAGHKKTCAGDLNCAICGELNFRHNLVGDRRAILNLIHETLDLSIEENRSMRIIFDRVYNYQRSAFAHQAEFRHKEDHMGQILPSAIPDYENVQSKSYRAELDLQIMHKIVRHVLLRWLAKANGAQFDDDLFELSPINPTRHISYQSVISVPANRWTRMG